MKFNRNNAKDLRSPRRGVAIIAVIALYAVAITMIGAWIHTALSHQRQARLRHEKMQTTWLADAGLRRAAAQLIKDSSYRGEHWMIESDQLGGKHAAAVEIRIEAIPPASEETELDNESAVRVRIVATAELPPGTGRHARHTKSTEVDLKKLN